MPKSHQYRGTQSLDIKEVACDAFAKVLEVQYGMNVNVKVEQIRG